MGEVENQLRSISDRVARLEVMQDQSKEDRNEIKASIDELTTVVGEMTGEFARYRGFVGGAALVAGLVWSAVTFLGEYFWSFISKGGA